MKELLEAGVHFGHQTKRWNPKMKEYIFGERNGIYIVDLQKTLKLFKDAMRFVAEQAAQGKTVLFVGTKRQAQEAVAEEATRCQQYYVNQRWLGGLLTNMTTVQRSIKRLKDLDSLANESGIEGRALATEQDFTPEKVVTDETPLEEIPEYTQFDPHQLDQLMSEGLSDEELPSMSLPRKGPSSEHSPEEVTNTLGSRE